MLVALALAVLALLPPGVMSARTGDGPLTLVTDSQGQPVAPAPMDSDAKAPCAFALLAAAATLPGSSPCRCPRRESAPSTRPGCRRWRCGPPDNREVPAGPHFPAGCKSLILR